VASEAGELEFVDCYGRRAPLGTSRIEPSTQRCPSPPTPVEITGVIRSVDSERRIVRAEDDAGRVRAFHIGVDVLRLEDLKPGERIQATGPIEGQITGLTRR
jgi:hypothetical protein